MSHLKIYNKILETQDNIFLILEDDAILNDNFPALLTRYMESLPTDMDIACINNGCNLHISPNQIKPNQIWYKTSATRTCCGYLITKSCCEQLIKTIIPFQNAIDHELNRQITINNFNVYWCEPTIIQDGSETIYKSSRESREN